MKKIIIVVLCLLGASGMYAQKTTLRNKKPQTVQNRTKRPTVTSSVRKSTNKPTVNRYQNQQNIRKAQYRQPVKSAQNSNSASRYPSGQNTQNNQPIRKVPNTQAKQRYQTWQFGQYPQPVQNSNAQSLQNTQGNASNPQQPNNAEILNQTKNATELVSKKTKNAKNRKSFEEVKREKELQAQKIREEKALKKAQKEQQLQAAREKKEALKLQREQEERERSEQKQISREEKKTQKLKTLAAAAETKEEALKTKKNQEAIKLVDEKVVAVPIEQAEPKIYETQQQEAQKTIATKEVINPPKKTAKIKVRQTKVASKKPEVVLKEEVPNTQINPLMTVKDSIQNTSQKERNYKLWTLQECVNYAAQHNLQVRQTKLNKDLQYQNLKAARRNRLPNLNLNIDNSASFSKAQTPFGTPEQTNNFNNTIGLGTDITIFNGSRLNREIRKNKYEVEASTFDIDKVRDDISIQIAHQYLNVLLNREVEAINKNTYENALQLLDRAIKTTNVGTTPQTVLAEARASVAREFQNVKTAEVNTKNALFDLAMTLQIDDYKNFDIAPAPELNNWASSFISKNEIIQKAFDTKQPQIKAAEIRIKAAAEQTKIARAAFYPVITANAGLRSSYFKALNKDLHESPLFKQYEDTFNQQVGLSLSLPIFNRGLSRVQVEQSKINEELAITNLKLQEKDIIQKIQNAANLVENNYAIYEAALEAEKSTKLALDFAEKSYQAGRTTIYDLTTARNNYANARGAVSQAKYNYIFQIKVLEFYAGTPLSL